MSVVSLPQAKEWLRITSAAEDARLQGVIDKAESSLAHKCGPLAPTSVTERVRVDGWTFTLRTTPVISLTSITGVISGNALPVDQYDVLPSGVAQHLYGWAFIETRYDVVYMAGRATVPQDLMNGIEEYVRYLWEPQRGQTARPGSQRQAPQAAMTPHGLPDRVWVLVKPYVHGPRSG